MDRMKLINDHMDRAKARLAWSKTALKRSRRLKDGDLRRYSHLRQCVGNATDAIWALIVAETVLVNMEKDDG